MRYSSTLHRVELQMRKFAVLAKTLIASKSQRTLFYVAMKVCRGEELGAASEMDWTWCVLRVAEGGS